MKKLAKGPDINPILIDQAMPKMKGLEPAKQIRHHRPDIQIILATSYSEIPEGGHAYITESFERPFSDVELERILLKGQKLI